MQKTTYYRLFQQQFASMDEKYAKDSHGKLADSKIQRRMKKMETTERCRNQKCSICLGDIENQIAVLPCSHTYCAPCILTWWVNNSTCPFCRKEFSYVINSKGIKMGIKDFSKIKIMNFEKTLRCEDCWADIGQEKMRICVFCRSTYIHERCLLPEESKKIGWKCEECLDREEKELQREEKKFDNPRGLSYFSSHATSQNSPASYRTRKHEK